jgi:hypothetical protein
MNCVQASSETTITSKIYQKIIRLKSGRLGCGNTSSRPSTASTAATLAKQRPKTANPVLQKNNAYYTISNLTFPSNLQSQSLNKLASTSQCDFHSASVASNLSMTTSCSNLLAARINSSKSRV